VGQYLNKSALTLLGYEYPVKPVRPVQGVRSLLYQDVPEASSPYPVSTDKPREFFRLRQ
jgi:hypothetical protein